MSAFPLPLHSVLKESFSVLLEAVLPNFLFKPYSPSRQIMVPFLHHIVATVVPPIFEESVIFQ